MKMRMLIATALLAASTGLATAEFYVMQNMQTQKCSVEQDYTATDTTQVLLNNKFTERKDAEAAMKDVPACN